MNHADALALLNRETQRARWALAIERGARLAVPLLGAILTWTIFALSGLHERLPYLLESLTALASWGAFLWLAQRARRGFVMPTQAEARTRLARDCKLSPAAFDTLGDKPIRYDAISTALWKREQAQAAARAEAARARRPRLRLHDLDRFRLRYVLPALALLAAFSAGAQAPERLTRAFVPDPAPFFGDSEVQIEAWASPAAYTGAGAIALSDRLGQTIATPPGVEATVRLTGPAGAPVLVFHGQGQRLAAHFHRAADGAWEARLQLPGPGKLSVVRFRERAFWRIASAPDRAPEAAFTAPISNLPDAQIGFSWRVRDDFGVTRLVLRMRPVDPPRGLEYAAPLDTPLDMQTGQGAALDGDATLDLSDHPYAGLEVEARLVAIDAIGQEGASEALTITLPQRAFHNPIAKAALEIRRALMAERRPYQPEESAPRRLIPAGDILIGAGRIEIRDPAERPPLARAPFGVRHAARLLDALTMTPQDHYFRDLAVFLGLRMARAELDVARDLNDADAAADLLWRTALRAEYGGAGDARRALEAAQAALDQALRAGAPPQRIRELMDALHRATDAYLRALVQDALQRGQSDNPETAAAQAQISAQDIEDMMAQVQRLSDEGRNAEAAAFLQQLASILEHLNVQLSEAGAGGGDSNSSAAQRRLQQSLDALSQTMGQQRALGDDTEAARAHQQQRQQQGGAGNAQDGAALAQRQGQIRQSLAQAQSQARAAGIAQNPDLNAAGAAMGEAEDALRRSDLNAARNAQDRALESLRQGAASMAAQMQGQGGPSGGMTGAGARDPLGRLTGGAGANGGDTPVPTDMDPARSRAVFDEIRRRAQDPSRPAEERDYLRRLLERFSAD